MPNEDSDRKNALLATIAETSKNARAVFFAQLTVCAYSLVTIFGTKDSVFLTAADAVRLPLVNVEISRNGFFIAGPALALLVLVYLTYYIHHLRCLLYTLFTDFKTPPDGWSAALYPWLIVMAATPHEPSHRVFVRISFAIRSNLVALSLWGLPLFVLWAFQWKYSANHAIRIMAFQGVLLSLGSLAVWSASRFDPYRKRRSPAEGILPAVASVAIALFSFCPVVTLALGYRAVPLLCPRVLNIGGVTMSNGSTEVELQAAYANRIVEIPDDKDSPWAMTALRRDAARGPRIAGRDLRGTIAEKAVLKGMRTESVDFSGAEFTLADLRYAVLRDTTLDGACMWGTDLREAKLAFDRLRGTVLSRANLVEADFESAELCGASLVRVDGMRADFTNANMTNAKLGGADLRRAIMNNSDLRGADLRKTVLTDATLSGAKTKGARYDSETKFPKNYHPMGMGMVYDGENKDPVDGWEVEKCRRVVVPECKKVDSGAVVRP